MRTLKQKRRSQQWRTLNPHAAFAPGGEADGDTKSFFDFWFEANDCTTALKQKDLRQRKARLNRLLAAKRKAEPILTKLLRDEMPVAESVQKLKLLVPDQGILRELFDSWSNAIKETPEQMAERRRDIERRGKEIAHTERLLKAANAITDGLTTLVEAAEAGDLDAWKRIVEAATQATVLVAIAEKKHPQLMKAIARTKDMWPLLASGESGWEQEAARQVKELGLGDEAQAFKVRLRKARGADTHLPARQWAKAAVRTIEETQFRAATISLFTREFGSRASFLTFMRKARWELGELPKWASEAMKLKPFCVTSLPEWKQVARQLIREQIPDFHTRPEWETQRASAAARGRDTPGEIQNAILDDIGSALARIAPSKDVPKSAC